MFRKLSVEKQRIISPILNSITKSWAEQMKNFWGNTEVFKDPHRIGKEDNPIVIYPIIAEALGVEYKDNIPFEYKGQWYIVSGKLNP